MADLYFGDLVPGGVVIDPTSPVPTEVQCAQACSDDLLAQEWARLVQSPADHHGRGYGRDPAKYFQAIAAERRRRAHG